MVLFQQTEKYIIFEIPNNGEFDWLLFYTPDYFKFCGLDNVVKIFHERPLGLMKGGYFQEQERLTIPYKYFVYVVEGFRFIPEFIKSKVKFPGSLSKESEVETGKDKSGSFFQMPQFLSSTTAPLHPSSAQHAENEMAKFEQEPELAENKPKLPNQETEVTEAEPELPKEEPEVSGEKPEVAKAEPELPKLEPEVSGEEPEVSKPEPELPKLEPELPKLEPEMETSVMEIGSDVVESDKPMQTIYIQFEFTNQDEPNGYFPDLADPDAFESNIELNENGYTYNDLEQVVVLEKYLEDRQKHYKNANFVPLYKEELFKINGRIIAIKSNSTDAKTIVDYKYDSMEGTFIDKIRKTKKDSMSSLFSFF
jgi:hypothetical protein